MTKTTAKAVTFNIGSVHNSSCPERPILQKAGAILEDYDYVPYRRGLIVYMVLEQQLKPCLRESKYQRLSVPELQRILVKELLLLKYDFGEQPADAQSLIDEVKKEIAMENQLLEPVTFNIEVNLSSPTPNDLLLGKAGNWVYRKSICEGEKVKRDPWHVGGGICQMVLKHRLMPCGLRRKLQSKKVVELQQILLERLINLGYQFPAQQEDAQKLIDETRARLSPATPKETTYSQKRTVTVVLERNGFTLAQAIRADEEFSGENIIEDMKAGGFKVVSSSYSKFEGRPPGRAGGGVQFFGWKEDND